MTTCMWLGGNGTWLPNLFDNFCMHIKKIPKKIIFFGKKNFAKNFFFFIHKKTYYNMTRRVWVSISFICHALNRKFLKKTKKIFFFLKKFFLHKFFFIDKNTQYNITTYLWLFISCICHVMRSAGTSSIKNFFFSKIFTFYVLHFTFYVLHFTFYVSHFTFYQESFCLL